MDALASQGSLTLTPDKAFLLAVNAASNDVSVFRVDPQDVTNLQLTGRFDSMGTMPTSLTICHSADDPNIDVVYVLNNGGDHPSISGFVLDRRDGTLLSIANSTRPLAMSNFAQVSFDSTCGFLVVSDKTRNALLVFRLLASMRVGMTVRVPVPALQPVVLSSNGTTPFGFTFDGGNHLLVTEVGGRAVSSYELQSNGSLRVISPSVVNNQMLCCWITTVRFSNGKEFAYTSNPGSQSLSSYAVDTSTGTLRLLSTTAATTRGRTLDLTATGNLLYALDPATSTVDVFQIQRDDGSLLPIQLAATGIPIYAQGIAVI